MSGVLVPTVRPLQCGALEESSIAYAQADDRGGLPRGRHGRRPAPARQRAGAGGLRRSPPPGQAQAPVHSITLAARLRHRGQAPSGVGVASGGRAQDRPPSSLCSGRRDGTTRRPSRPAGRATVAARRSGENARVGTSGDGLER